MVLFDKVKQFYYADNNYYNEKPIEFEIAAVIIQY